MFQLITLLIQETRLNVCETNSTKKRIGGVEDFLDFLRGLDSAE